MEAGEITRLLSHSRQGDDDAHERLVAILYAELHVMAQSKMRGERSDHTLGATGLVNETFMRLFRASGEVMTPGWQNRAAFFSAAATAMRRVLIDHARAKKSQKRGGGKRSSTIGVDAVAAAESMDPADFLSLDDAISRLATVDQRASEVVRLRFFGGQEIEAVAEMLGVSARTVKRDWEFARAWLRDQFQPDGDGLQ